MSLFERKRIINFYPKNKKKSIRIRIIERIDLFLILALFIIITGPSIVNFIIKLNSELKKANLFLSPYCIELFGKEITEKLLQDFNEANPDIRIQILNIPDEKNREPDIFIFDENEYRALISAGTLMLLNSYVEFEPEADLYVIPLVSFMDLLFYNIELLSAVGFDRPPKTREEFLSYAKTISNSSNVRRAYFSGTAISLSPEDKQALSRDIFSWIWAAGGDFWSGEGAPVLDARTAAADLLFFYSLYNEGVLAPGIFETTGEQRLEEFSRGRVSMLIGSTRAIPFLRENMGDDAFGITAVPVSGLTGKYNIRLSGIYAGINAKSAHPEEAWKFIEFLAGQYQLFDEIFKPAFSVTSDIIPDEYITDDPFYSKTRDIFESSEIIRSFSGNPNAQKYENVFMEEFKALLAGSQTARETVNSIQLKWNAIDAK